jgi:hypothetical protein
MSRLAGQKPQSELPLAVKVMEELDDAGIGWIYQSMDQAYWNSSGAL